MKIGVVGLGRMGEAIVYRLVKGGFEVFGFDPSESSRNAIGNLGATPVETLTALAETSDVIWLMVPAGDAVDKIINEIKASLRKDTIVIDGGNSNFQNSVRRAKELEKNGIAYLDCGTSGGLKGRDIGFSLMIGGDHIAYEKVKTIFQAVAAPNGYAHVGPSGAGHYVKMIHNGIEYSLLQSYAEGFHLLKKNNRYKELNLERISRVWSHGSVIRSWILDLAHEVFEEDQELTTISGEIGENKTGRWTMDETKEQDIPMDLLKRSLEVRKESREGKPSFATKVVSMLRNKFGGHKVS
jgi:6-phosphogluconate dehydrogenase